MSKMKDIQSKSDKDLADYVNEKREAVRQFRFTMAGSRTKNVRAVRADKREIARALTEQTNRKKEEANQATK